jgi:small redox-active disulfide protein 2
MVQITILGSGCARCDQLTEATTRAAEELGLLFTLERLKDPLRFADYGVMTPPALVVDGKVLARGRVPSVEALKNLLSGCTEQNDENEKLEKDNARRSAALRGRRNWLLDLGKNHD